MSAAARQKRILQELVEVTLRHLGKDDVTVDDVLSAASNLLLDHAISMYVPGRIIAAGDPSMAPGVDKIEREIIDSVDKTASLVARAFAHADRVIEAGEDDQDKVKSIVAKELGGESLPRSRRRRR